MKEAKLHMTDQEKLRTGYFDSRTDLELFVEENIDREIGDGCEHREYCLLAKISTKCDNYRSCQTWKYYNRYGEGYNQIGI